MRLCKCNNVTVLNVFRVMQSSLQSILEHIYNSAPLPLAIIPLPPPLPTQPWAGTNTFSVSVALPIPDALK